MLMRTDSRRKMRPSGRRATRTTRRALPAVRPADRGAPWFVPLALGSDTNGSIRVPASLCGVFGLKPTYGRLPRTGAYPFVDSLDHVGPFATTTADLAACYDALQGADASDPACAQRAPQPVSSLLAQGRPLRVARLTGYFDRYASEEALAASKRAAEAL